MNLKEMTAIAAGFTLLWSTAQAGPESVQSAPSQSRAPIAAEVPESAGAPGSDVIVLEVQPMPGQGSEEEIAAMQMLLLQLLMMQQESDAAGLQIPSRSAPQGVEI